MKNKLMYPLIVAAFVACGSDRNKTDQAAANYETVQEGSAAGVTSTIQGPGETVPPLTGTNADTTSAFALNPNAIPPAPAGGTLAGTLPADLYPPAGAPPTGTTYRPPVTRTAPRPAAAQPAPQPMFSSSEQQPTAPPRQQQQPATDTTATQAAPPPPAPTETTATQPPPEPTQTQTAPPAEKPKQEAKPPAEDESEPEATETAPPPPPPPAR